MNDKRFKELLNEYLDGELSGADLLAFKKALSESPRYRNLMRQYQCLQTAQVVACRRQPRLRIGLFPLGRICRNGAMLMNTTVLLLTIGLFQARDPINTNFDGTTAVSEEKMVNEVVYDQVKMPMPAVSGMALSSFAELAALNSASPDGPSVHSSSATAPVQIAEPIKSNSVSQPFLERSILSDEYGFVIL